MSPSQGQVEWDDESGEQDFKPHRLAIVACRAWEVFCAAMFLICVGMQSARLFDDRAIRWREIVAWVCFDALFLLGAYAGFDFLCTGKRGD